MDSSILLQKQIRDNAQDLQTHLSDLKCWETEMKRKESELTGLSIEQALPPVRSKPKKNKCLTTQPNKPEKRISSSDYAAWDKFDIDKACEMVDTEDMGPPSQDGKLSEEDKKLKLREEAQYEKERGNQFVKLQKWDEAISCYTQAINLYKDDAIYYANRALCYLKKENVHAAEADCSRALELDPGYVKALQRRSCAREALGSLRSAAEDLRRLLALEPHNITAQRQLASLTERMGTKGPNSKSSPATTPSPSDSSKSFTDLDDAKSETPVQEIKLDIPQEMSKQETTVPDVAASPSKEAQPEPESVAQDVEDDSPKEKNVKPQGARPKKTSKKSGEAYVEPINIPPHLRSKKPLVPIGISEIPRGYTVTAIPMKDSASGITKIISKHINKKSTLKGDSKKTEPSSESGKKKKLPFPKKLEIVDRTEDEENNVLLSPVEISTNSLVEVSTKKYTKPSKGNVIEKPKIVVVSEEVNTNAGNDGSVKSDIKVNTEGSAASSLQNSAGKKSRNKKKGAKTLDSGDLQKLQLNDPPDVNQVPKSSVQFSANWRFLKGKDKERSAYLKAIPPASLPSIFQNFLESDTLSEILKTIEVGEDFTRVDPVTRKCCVASLPYLQGLSKVKRFAAQVMFLSNEEKKVIANILHRCKEHEGCSQNDLNDIKNKYEI